MLAALFADDSEQDKMCLLSSLCLGLFQKEQVFECLKSGIFCIMNKINKNWSRVSQREAQAASKADQGRGLYNMEHRVTVTA